MSFSEYIGRFHAALVHLPIGIFLAVVALECLALKEKYKTILPAAGILLKMGFLAACFAAGTGYLHKEAEAFDPGLVTTHLSFAITLVVVSLITTILFNKRAAIPRVYYSSLAVLTIVIVVAGHTGANLTYGVDYLFPTNLGQREKPLTNLSMDAQLYSDLIKPVLNKKCVGCHGPSRQKGKLRLDSPEFITKGGEDGAILNHDLPEESDFWNRITLDPGNDDHMPPSEKPQLTKAELSLILYWLSQGTDFKSTLGSLPKSDSIILRVADLSGETEDAAEHSVEMPDENLLTEFREGGVTISFLAKDDGRISLQFINADDSKLSGLMDKLTGVKEQVVEIKLPGKKLSREGWKKLTGLPELQKLNAEGSDFSDADVEVLASLNKLRYLNLVGTSVTAAGLSKIKLASLKYLYLFKTGVTVSDGLQLKQQFPSAEIVIGNFQVPTLGSDTTEQKEKYVVPLIPNP